MKTLILSDFHLGHPFSRVERCLPALARLAGDCERVIVNGDALERFASREEEPEAPALVQKLREALAGRSGPPLFLTGNHDPLISDTHHAYLEEPRLLVCHGDYAMDRAVPWLRQEMIFEKRFREALRERAAEPSFTERAALFRKIQVQYLREVCKFRSDRHPLRYVLRHLLPPTRAVRIAHYVWSSPKRMARMAAHFERPVRHLACGHTHRSGRWTIESMEVYNTGSFMPLSTAYAVLVEGERVRHLPLAGLLGGRRAVQASAAGGNP